MATPAATQTFVDVAVMVPLTLWGPSPLAAGLKSVSSTSWTRPVAWDPQVSPLTTSSFLTNMPLVTRVETGTGSVQIQGPQWEATEPYGLVALSLQSPCGQRQQDSHSERRLEPSLPLTFGLMSLFLPTELAPWLASLGKG